MPDKIKDKRSFAIFKNLDSDVIDNILDAFWARLVPDEGACESMQGELVRAISRIEGEGFRNGNLNWTSVKFDLNESRYPKGYIPHNRDDDYIPGRLAKCSATKIDLNNASPFDEMLNFMKGWLAKHPVPEWSIKHQAKIQAALERARPIVPIGVISEAHWDKYDEKRNREHHTGYSYEDEAFIKAQIAYWIFRNPNLVNKRGKSLGESVASEFEYFIEELWE